ncbi:hypothetical protein BU16DRAFT_566820 [Lophium mytilinum]|uniref:Uncharacterized protein n=1 Tax=Lophium mytilinum TaxID=390894 RepID=A0A6A6QC99_9PEZI|nr:hypothetical protein BU16DRAFT_566820 [Lophium mytilinum]
MARKRRRGKAKKAEEAEGPSTPPPGDSSRPTTEDDRFAPVDYAAISSEADVQAIYMDLRKRGERAMKDRFGPYPRSDEEFKELWVEQHTRFDSLYKFLHVVNPLAVMELTILFWTLTKMIGHIGAGRMRAKMENIRLWGRVEYLEEFVEWQEKQLDRLSTVNHEASPPGGESFEGFQGGSRDGSHVTENASSTTPPPIFDEDGQDAAIEALRQEFQHLLLCHNKHSTPPDPNDVSNATDGISGSGEPSSKDGPSTHATPATGASNGENSCDSHSGVRDPETMEPEQAPQDGRKHLLDDGICGIGVESDANHHSMRGLQNYTSRMMKAYNQHRKL